MKRYTTIITAIAAACLLAACYDDDAARTPVPSAPGEGGALQIYAQKEAFLEEDGRTRATTDDDLKTTFQTGDAIGVFAVKDGAVLADCKNLKLTRQSDGSWAGNTVYLTTGARYFAYSPYRDEAGINNATTPDEVYAAFQVSQTQNTAALYAANDLMTSDPVAPNAMQKSLSFSFAHRLALLEFDALYCKGNGNLYPLYGYSLGAITVGNDAWKGYSIATTGQLTKVRILMKPDSNIGFIAAFNSSVNNVLEFVIEKKLPSTGGRRYKVRPYKNRQVKVGDYYISDGTIFPKEWVDRGKTPPLITDTPKKTLGVVFSTPTASTANSNHFNMLTSDMNAGYKNGYVLSVDYYRGTRFTLEEHIPYTIMFRWEGAADIIADALSKFPLTFTDRMTSASVLHANAYSGYRDLATANSDNPLYSSEKIYNPGTWDEMRQPYHVYKYPMYGLNAMFADEQPPLPSNTSGWFPPSAKQMTIAMRNLGGVTGLLFNSNEDNNWTTYSSSDVKYAQALNVYFTRVGADEANKNRSFLTCSSNFNGRTHCLISSSNYIVNYIVCGIGFGGPGINELYPIFAF